MPSALPVVMREEVIDAQRMSEKDIRRRRDGQRLERKDVVDEIVMIEVECRAAFDVRPIFGAEAEERPRAEAGVVEVDASSRAQAPAVAVAIGPAGGGVIRVSIILPVRELGAADGEVERRP